MNIRSIRIILGCLLLAVAACTIYYFAFPHVSDVAPASGASREPLSTTTAPVTLQIPALGVNAKVQYVGKTAAGNMGIPSNFTDVAWYKLGPEPGIAGKAVIVGHLDNALGLRAVFADLGKLKVGDDLYVRTEGSDTLHFKVTGSELYAYTDKVTSDVFGSSTKAELNLITCSGTWLQSKRNYDKRLVVFTELVD